MKTNFYVIYTIAYVVAVKKLDTKQSQVKWHVINMQDV